MTETRRQLLRAVDPVLICLVIAETASRVAGRVAAPYVGAGRRAGTAAPGRLRSHDPWRRPCLGRSMPSTCGIPGTRS